VARRTKRKLKSKLRFVLFCCLLAGLFAGGFFLANNVLWPALTDIQTGEKDLSGGGEDEDLAKLPGVTVLMLGVDERENFESDRTDTMILAHIDNEDNRLSLLSIPRDTKVYIPGYGENKINAANFYGGPDMAMDIVEGLTGVPVDYYMLTNFDGFKNVVDILGGVEIDVEKNMYHRDPDLGDINLKKGRQLLDGDKALQYVRYRGDAMGDITRTQRQLKLLTAIGEKLMTADSITKLPRLVPELYRNVETNIGLKQALALARAAKNLDNIQIVTQTLPGRFLDENGISYWYVDPGQARKVVTAFFEEGKVVEVVQGGTIIKNTRPAGSGAGGTSQVAMDMQEQQDMQGGASPAQQPVEPAPEPAPEPAAEPAPEPAPEPVPEPAPEPAPAGDSGDTGAGGGTTGQDDTGPDQPVSNTGEVTAPAPDGDAAAQQQPPSTGDHVEIIIYPAPETSGE